MTTDDDKMRLGNPAALGALARGDLANFLVASAPGGIEAQEAQGQADLCASAKLPRDYGHGKNTEDKEALGSAGVVFGEPVDDLFEAVTLPEGWKLQPTEHSMHSELLDHKGRKRAGVFYKAAFYDLKASINVCRRFNLTNEYPDDFRAAGPHFGIVTDGGAEIWRSPEIFDDERIQDDKGGAKTRALATEIGWDAVEKMRGAERALAAARVWLNENHPDHNSLTAYWDQD